MWNWDEVELGNTSEIARIAGVQGQAIGDGGRGDHGIVRASGRLSAGATKRCRYSPKRSRGSGIERQCIEVGLSLLQMRLPRDALLVRSGNQRTHRKLPEGNRRDGRLLGQSFGIPESRQQDDRGGVQDASRCARPPYSHGSSTSSSSARNLVGSTAGSWRQWASNVSAVTRGRLTGHSSATGRPSRVTVIRSPLSTRSTTSPPRLRRSRIVTCPIEMKCITRETHRDR